MCCNQGPQEEKQGPLKEPSEESQIPLAEKVNPSHPPKLVLNSPGAPTSPHLVCILGGFPSNCAQCTSVTMCLFYVSSLRGKKDKRRERSRDRKERSTSRKRSRKDEDRIKSKAKPMKVVKLPPPPVQMCLKSACLQISCPKQISSDLNLCSDTW